MSILFPSYSMGLFSLIVMILSFPLISLIIRRLHDSERSGSWILLILAPLFIGIGVWSYSHLFYSSDPDSGEVSIEYRGMMDDQEMYIASNGDTILFRPSSYMEAQRDGHMFEGTRNGNPIMIDPSVINATTGHDQRVFYGTAGIVSFLFVFWLVGLIILVVMCSLRGTEGPNRYGTDPGAA